MIPCTFVIAVPKDWTGAGAIGVVEQPDQVRRDRPSIWLAAGTRSLSLGEGGLIVGPLLRKGGASPVDSLGTAFGPHCTPIDIVAGLARDFWGAYFAVGTDPARGSIWAFCEPCGLLPIYRAACRDHILLASEVHLLIEAGMKWPAIAWPTLVDHLRHPELRQAQTCLSGVDQLVPGSLLGLGQDAGPTIPVWRPGDFMPQSRPPALAESAAKLASCAVETIGAWADLLGPVAVAASGGVDSSFICGALTRAGKPFGCITLATTDPSGDERTFVTMLGRHLDVEVAEGVYDAALVDIARPASLGLPRPSRRTFLQALDAALDQARAELGVNAVFDGNGGDNLFCFLHSAAPVMDCLSNRGFGPALSTMVEMCAVTGCDIAAMCAASWRRYRRSATLSPWVADHRLLARDLRSDLQADITPALLTPWLDIDVGTHRGKLDHLALILHAQNHIHGLGNPGSKRFSPLMSQPLVELCLSLPTWLWCEGGINRAVARQAFAADLPPSIVRRTSKAGPDSMIRQVFARNRRQIRDFLLGGRLTGEGVIDPVGVELALATDVLSHDAIVYRLLDLLEAEVWVRSWQG